MVGAQLTAQLRPTSQVAPPVVGGDTDFQQDDRPSSQGSSARGNDGDDDASKGDPPTLAGKSGTAATVTDTSTEAGGLPASSERLRNPSPVADQSSTTGTNAASAWGGARPKTGENMT